MDHNLFFHSKEFQSLPIQKQAILIEMTQKIKGRPLAETLDIILEAYNALSQGVPLTSTEQNAIINALRANMDKQELQRMDEVLCILQSMENHP